MVVYTNHLVFTRWAVYIHDGSGVCKFGFVGRLRNVDSTVGTAIYTAELYYCCPSTIILFNVAR